MRAQPRLDGLVMVNVELLPARVRPPTARASDGPPGGLTGCGPTDRRQSPAPPIAGTSLRSAAILPHRQPGTAVRPTTGRSVQPEPAVLIQPEAAGSSIPCRMPASSSAVASIRTGTAPTRTTDGGPLEQSTIVDGRPPLVRPPSRISSHASPMADSAASASRASGSPERLADVVGSGPSIRDRARGVGWSGTRTPSVAVPAVRAGWSGHL